MDTKGFSITLGGQTIIVTQEEAHAHLMRGLAETAAAQLEGTGNSMPEEFEQYLNDATFCAVLDGRVFECTQCGWWCPTDQYGKDVNGELACDECSPEDEE